ncbi:MAG: hypothetical protein SF028_11185 [Candidatus Sumerlaeia bacterium]|nr:hypothetical protein [Candidatus Sumerlaeia bacterium]
MRLALLLLLILSLLPASAPAQSGSASFRSKEQLDEAGKSLRRAVTAWQNAERQSLPAQWAPLLLPPGGRADFGGGVSLLLVRVRDAEELEATVLVTSPDGADTKDLAAQAPAQLGPLEAQVMAWPHENAGRALLLVRRAGDPPPLADPAGKPASPKIEGDSATGILTVTSNDAEELRFARTVLDALAAGEAPEAASRKAFAAVPPRSRPARLADASYEPAPRLAAESDFDGGEDEGYFGAGVTLRAVSGTSEAIRELESTLRYNSEGRRGQPPTRVKTGPDGAEVVVGGPEDQFSGRLKVLEANGEVNATNESYTYVPLDRSRASMVISDGTRTWDVLLRARPAGGDAAEVEIDLIDRTGAAGKAATRTRARVRDGQSILISKLESSRREEYRSAPPLLGDLPWIGGVIGGSGRNDSTATTALFATIDLQ